MDGSNVSAPARSMPNLLIDDDEEDMDYDDMNASSLSAPVRSSSSPSLTALAAESAAKERKLARMKKLNIERRVTWDDFVERDQTKRELTRQFRSALPEWQQKQMAHRVHYCNIRKKELEAFKREFAEIQEEVERPRPAPQEIQVAPAAGGWFERNDRDISAEFLMMDVDLFGTKKRNIHAGRSVASF